MFLNGISIDEIADKIGKNAGEVQFAISYLEMKKKIKFRKKYKKIKIWGKDGTCFRNRSWYNKFLLCCL